MDDLKMGQVAILAYLERVNVRPGRETVEVVLTFSTRLTPGVWQLLKRVGWALRVMIISPQEELPLEGEEEEK